MSSDDTRSKEADASDSDFDGFLDAAAAEFRRARGRVRPAVAKRLASRWVALVAAQGRKTHFSELVTMASGTADLYRATGERVPILLDLSIAGWRAVVDDPKFNQSTSRAISWNNLAESLRLKFERDGSVGLLDEAMSCQRSAVAALSDDIPNHPDYYAKLSHLLLLRAAAGGDPQDRFDSVRVVEAWVDGLSHASLDYITGLRLLSYVACQSELLSEMQRAAARLGAFADMPGLPPGDRQGLLLSVANCLCTQAKVARDLEHCTTAAAGLQSLLLDPNLDPPVVESIEDSLARVNGIRAFDLHDSARA